MSSKSHHRTTMTNGSQQKDRAFKANLASCKHAAVARVLGETGHNSSEVATGLPLHKNPLHSKAKKKLQKASKTKNRIQTADWFSIRYSHSTKKICSHSTKGTSTHHPP